MPRDESARRDRMVDDQIAARGVRDPLVLAALRKVPRHLFVPADMRAAAYADEPLPIGGGQTISQPYIVGTMTEALGLRDGDRVLEIGTGSGYQTAVLAEIAAEVFTVEIVPELGARARETLSALGYGNISYRTGDGAEGWPERAPYDAVCVTAAPPSVPRALREQLAVGGRMIIPIGGGGQTLVLVRRTPSGYEDTELMAVRFVPLVEGRRT